MVNFVESSDQAMEQSQTKDQMEDAAYLVDESLVDEKLVKLYGCGSATAELLLDSSESSSQGRSDRFGSSEINESQHYSFRLANSSTESKNGLGHTSPHKKFTRHNSKDI